MARFRSQEGDTTFDKNFKRRSAGKRVKKSHPLSPTSAALELNSDSIFVKKSSEAASVCSSSPTTSPSLSIPSIHPSTKASTSASATTSSDDDSSDTEEQPLEHSEDDEEEDLVSWKFLYFNKTRIENISWLIKREPEWKTRFFRRDEGIGSPEFAHKHHLFLTVIKKWGDYVICGSGVYEIAADPSTMLIGNRIFCVFNVHIGDSVRVLEGHAGATMSLDCLGDQFLSSGRFGTDNICLWDIETGERVRSYNGHRRSVFKASFEFSERIVSCAKDSYVKIWDVNSSAAISSVKFSRPVRTFCTHDSSIYCGTDEKRVVLLNAITMQKLKKIAVPSNIVGMKVIGETAVFLGSSGAYQYDLRTLRQVRKFTRKPNGSKFSSSKSTRELYVDDEKLLMATTSGKLVVVDWNTGKSLASLSLGRQRLAFDFDPIDGLLVTGDAERTIKCWDHGGRHQPELHENSFWCSLM